MRANAIAQDLEQRYRVELERMLLTIHVARYGIKGSDRDVTDLLRKLATATELDIMVDNKSLGGDPAYGQPKTLTVVYSIGDLEPRHKVKQDELKRLRIGGPIRM